MTAENETDTLTADTFFNGRLRISQMRNGYRFSIDAVLLAHAVQPKAGQTVMDLGTGCGIIPLILAHRFPTVRILAVEVQPELADLARRNVAANQMQQNIQVIEDDLRRLTADSVSGPVDWIIANPPYRRSGSGRVNPASQKALARHEIQLDLPQLIKAVRRLLRTGGRFAVIYPAERTADLLSRMRASGVEPKWLQTVHSYEKEPARRVIVSGAMAGHPGMTVAAPLVIYNQDSSYSDEVQAIMAP